ncbi:MAG TPA: molybdate ABC transporter substrate-binding protein [Acidimicrobiia bacterium]|nr:molybdate ABC transporter substrate-binding protein [Acidimicrobiia bacterium]
MRRWAAIGLLTIAACGASGDGDREVLVSAAASLTDAFREMEAAFEAANPEIDVLLNFASSSTLREQILEGAPVDVFASASTANMDLVIAAGGAEEDVTFVTNSLEIAVPEGNPGGIVGLEDFSNPDLLIGLCVAGVPCGEFGREALRRAGVVPEVDTEEPDVRALLTKIESGELDAGITYVTDVQSSEATEGIEIPREFNVVAAYSIAVLANAPSPRQAEALLDFVLSAEGQEILQSYGFGSP